jgi:hypothetical protein
MESHQATKLDTSGTAKAVIACFQKLGARFDMNEVGLLIKAFVNWTIFGLAIWNKQLKQSHKEGK